MQNYKYLKGSAADFVGAPDWAMVAVILDSPCDSSVDFAMEYVDGSRVYYTDQDREDAIGKIKNWKLKAHREPIPQWNGNGLPPVGADCEIYQHPEFGVRPGTAETGTKVKVVAHETTTGKNSVAVVFWVVDGAGNSDVFIAECLRPLGTEAERKREAISKLINEQAGASGTLGIVIYDAIAAGKIPGIKLED